MNKSAFARSIELLLETDLCTFSEWASRLFVEEDVLHLWLNDHDIPTPLQLWRLFEQVCIAYTREHLSIKYFFTISQIVATEVSPFGELMLPSVWIYMNRPPQSDVARALDGMTRDQQRRYLRQLYAPKQNNRSGSHVY